MSARNLPRFEVDRLRPEERALWEEHFASGEDFFTLRVWSFGYWCMLALDGVPKVVGEWLADVDPDNLIHQYLENVKSHLANRRE